MIKLLIADDEPLVQAGIKSMVNWEEHGIHIIGTAANGAIAYGMIVEHSPEIVITDIKMPVMSGLELAQKCKEEHRDLPVFIILTSYEEFGFAKEALSYQVTDYLVKLELTPDSLEAAINHALEKVESLQSLQSPAQFPQNSISSIYLLREQFFTRLILNLFGSEHQFLTQEENLHINFQNESYAVAYVEVNGNKAKGISTKNQLHLYTSSLQIASELISKYAVCHVLSLDIKHFAIVFFLNQAQAADYKQTIQKALEQMASMLFNYYSVAIRASIGGMVREPLKIASSFQDSKQVFSHTDEAAPIRFAEDISFQEPLKNVFNMSLFKEDIRKAYAEFDEKALYDIFTSIIELFEGKPTHYVQALDAAGNILYMSLSLLNNGEQTVSEIFQDKANGYRSLYELTDVEQILDWLRIFRDGLCKSFASHNKDYKNHIVINVKKYIQEHIDEKLTLNRVAEVFNISPNYLSVLFSKHNDLGFTDYINQSKMEAAKEMMKDGKMKIYEISNILGFESAFYFSRVFKKFTGVSPRDYMNQILP